MSRRPGSETVTLKTCLAASTEADHTHNPLIRNSTLVHQCVHVGTKRHVQEVYSSVVCNSQKQETTRATVLTSHLEIFTQHLKRRGRHRGERPRSTHPTSQLPEIQSPLVQWRANPPCPSSALMSPSCCGEWLIEIWLDPPRMWCCLPGRFHPVLTAVSQGWTLIPPARPSLLPTGTCSTDLGCVSSSVTHPPEGGREATTRACVLSCWEGLLGKTDLFNPC